MIPRYIVEDLSDGYKYTLLDTIIYTYKGKTVTVGEGYRSDGATGPAIDIPSKAWWVHDYLCEYGKWDDGSVCTNFEASAVLAKILFDEGRWFRSGYWFCATFLFGGGQLREHMI